MSTYTKEEENIYFLNDKNIAQTIGDDTTSKVNSIPSLDLINNLCATTDQISSNLTRDLSTYANDLSDALCATVNTRREEDKVELSNVLSTYANQLCTQVSIELSVDRVLDKAELSNVLSSYTDSKIISLSSSLSDQINNEFVHKFGDSMTGTLSIANELIVDKIVTLKGNTKVLNNFTQGKNTFVHNDIDRGIAMGISAVADQNDAFVWNGDDTRKDYNAQDNKPGSFNINPRGEANGFYIGSRNLSTIIHDDILLTANSLTSDINAISNEICATVDIRRNEDKSELSLVLSGYTNDISTLMSSYIDTNRASDHTSAMTEAFGYVKSLSNSISAFIDNAKYSKIDKVGFSYNDQTHKITLSVADQFDEPRTFEIDSSEFIKNRIVDHVDVVTPEQDPKLSETVLRIWWTPEEGKTEGIYTDVPLSQLARVYKAGDGISISKDLYISVVDYNEITANLKETSTDVNILSNVTIPAIDNRLTSVEKYVVELSSPVFGKIDTLSIDLHKLSDSISAEVNALSNTVVNTISVDLDKVEEHANRLQAYADQLSGASGWIGDVPYLSGNIDELRKEIRGAANFCGYVAMSKYHPDWIEVAGETNTISTFFKYVVNRGTENPIKNGNIYEVKFSTATGFSMNDPVYAADQFYDFDDGIRIAHNDFIAVYIPDGSVEIPLTALNKDTVHIISDTRFFEHYQLSNTVFANMPWLSGGNRLTARYNSGIIKDGNDPIYITTTGHAISGNNDIFGNNHFLDGDNRFDGYNFIEELSTYTLSTEKLSGCDVEIDDLSVFLAKADHLSVFKLSADQLSASKLSVSNLSGYELVADGISAYQLSANKLSAYRADMYDLSVGNNLSIANMLSVEKDATFASTVQIKNNLTVDNALTATNELVSIAPNITTGSDLSVYGNTYLEHALNVVDDATFDKNIEVLRDATIRQKAIVDGNLSVSNDTLYTITTTRAVVLANTSAETLTCNWNNVVNPDNEFTLADLSNAVSAKITIDDRVNHELNGTSDLSIVKIAKDKFDEMVADEHSIMSANTLFVVDSDYIDAYGQVISNLAMDKNDPSYMLGIAASKPYVDFVSSNISTTVDQNRIADKKELSNVLSTYANSLCASISSTVDQNRIADKKELSNVLSTYTDNEMQKLSNVLSSISYSLKHDCILSNGITNDSNISTILSATVYIFNLLSSL